MFHRFHRKYGTTCHLCRDSHVPHGSAYHRLRNAVGRRLRGHCRVPPRPLPLLEDVVGLGVGDEFGGAPGAHAEEDLDRVAAALDIDGVEEGAVVGEEAVERLVRVRRRSAMNFGLDFGLKRLRLNSM